MKFPPEPAVDVLLECTAVSKHFGGPMLLKHVDLRVSASESVAVVGESGSGKSTLLHVLAGLETPSAGQVRIRGTNLWSCPIADRKQLQRQAIGLVFQAFYLLPHLTAEQNIALPWLLDGQRPDRERILHLMERMRISHRRQAKPAELSGGEQQRVAIARALALRPPLILADEPTGNLDTRNANEVLDLLLQQCKDDGHALVMVTHSQRAAARMGCTLKLEDGQLQPATFA